MIGLTITFGELSALSGLPHIQQLTYLIGLRPFVDYKTGIIGIKRGVSYQSISESLYVEPHPGIISGRPSKAQLRRALKGLERAGLLTIQSLEKKLVVQCNLVTLGYSAQNKVVTKPSHEMVIEKRTESFMLSSLNDGSEHEAVPTKTAKPVIPLRDNLNNNNIIEIISDIPVKKPISSNFQPSSDTITRAQALGYTTATDFNEIQNFIQYNQAIGSLWADFNPIYLRWLSESKERNSLKSPRTRNVAHDKGNVKSTNSHKQSLVAKSIEAWVDSNIQYCEDTKRFNDVSSINQQRSYCDFVDTLN